MVLSLKLEGWMRFAVNTKCGREAERLTCFCLGCVKWWSVMEMGELPPNTTFLPGLCHVLATRRKADILAVVIPSVIAVHFL